MEIDITSFLKHGLIGDISVGKIFLPSQFAHGVSSDTHENGLPVAPVSANVTLASPIVSLVLRQL